MTKIKIDVSGISTIEGCAIIIGILVFGGAPWWLYIIVLSIFSIIRRHFIEPPGKYEALASLSTKARLGNLLLAPAKKFQLLKEFKALDVEKFKKEAIKRTGYDDFGDSDYEQKFQGIIALSLDNSPLGHFSVRELIRRSLLVKLRTQNELKRPAVASYIQTHGPIRKPLFVTGMPRTGTTYLHKLLSMDPAARAPLVYEMLDPVPRIRDDYEKDREKRIKWAQKPMDIVMDIIPAFHGLHMAMADDAEECLVAMTRDAPTFFETFYPLAKNPRTFREWNIVQAYKNYEKFLQLLDYQEHEAGRTGQHERWVLKCPLHLPKLPNLSEVFEDARIVWTHRDLKSAIPSWASFLRISQSLVKGGIIQLDDLGKISLEYAEDILKQGDDFFSNAANQTKHPMANVSYTTLIGDPIGTVKKLYDQLGYEFTDEYEGILKRFIDDDNKKRNEQKKSASAKKLHSYSLDEYGLTEEMINEKLDWYNKKYLS